MSEVAAGWRTDGRHHLMRRWGTRDTDQRRPGVAPANVVVSARCLGLAPRRCAGLHANVRSWTAISSDCVSRHHFDDGADDCVSTSRSKTPVSTPTSHRAVLSSEPGAQIVTTNSWRGCDPVRCWSTLGRPGGCFRSDPSTTHSDRSSRSTLDFLLRREHAGRVSVHVDLRARQRTLPTRWNSRVTVWREPCGRRRTPKASTWSKVPHLRRWRILGVASVHYARCCNRRRPTGVVSYQDSCF